MGEREGIILNNHVAESEGDVVHPDDISPDQLESNEDIFYKAAVIAANELAVDDYTAESYGSAFADVRNIIESGISWSKANGINPPKVQPAAGKQRIEVAHYIAIDVFDMKKQGIITNDGYNYLFAEYTAPIDEPPKPKYESGQATYKDWRSAQANDRED